MKRRLFLFAAPAIIAAPSLMWVSAAALPVSPADRLDQLFLRVSTDNGAKHGFNGGMSWL